MVSFWTFLPASSGAGAKRSGPRAIAPLVIIAIAGFFLFLAGVGHFGSGSYPVVDLGKTEVAQFLELGQNAYQVGGIFSAPETASSAVAIGARADINGSGSSFPPSPSHSGLATTLMSPSSAETAPAAAAPTTILSEEEWASFGNVSGGVPLQELKPQTEEWAAIPELSSLHDRSGENAFAVYTEDTMAFGPDARSPQFVFAYSETALIDVSPALASVRSIDWNGRDTLTIALGHEQAFEWALKHWDVASTESQPAIVLVPAGAINSDRAFFKVSAVSSDAGSKTMVFAATPCTMHEFGDYEYAMDAGNGFRGVDEDFLLEFAASTGAEKPWKTKYLSFAVKNDNSLAYTSDYFDMGLKCASCSFSGKIGFSVRGGKHHSVDVKVATEGVSATAMLEAYMTGHLVQGFGRDYNLLQAPLAQFTIPNFVTFSVSLSNYIGYKIGDISATGRLRTGVRMTVPDSDIQGHLEPHTHKSKLRYDLGWPTFEVYKPSIGGSLDANGVVYHGVKMVITVQSAFSAVSASVTATLDWKIPEFSLTASTQFSQDCDLCGDGKIGVSGSLKMLSILTKSIVPTIGGWTPTWLLFENSQSQAVVDLVDFCLATGPTCTSRWKKVGSIKEEVPNAWMKELEFRESDSFDASSLLSLPPPTDESVDDFADIQWTDGHHGHAGSAQLQSSWSGWGSEPWSMMDDINHNGADDESM